MITKKSLLFISIVILMCLGTMVWFAPSIFHGLRKFKEPIKVGILYSLTGPYSGSEKNMVDVIQLAIEEINQKGGVLGRQLEPVIYDGKSSDAEFAVGAKELIEKEKVPVIFGCWTSSSRKTVKPIIEKANNLLFNATQYEGLEESPNIINTGGAPNQVLMPAVTWAFQTIGKRFYIVGSDYIFPRSAAAIMAYQVAMLGGEVVGSTFIPVNGNEVEPAIQAILATKPDVILNVINGITNAIFYKKLRVAGINPEDIPVVSFELAEPELAEMSDSLAGNFAVWNYFENIDREENRVFIAKFQKKYGREREIGNNMEAAYDSVHLWAQAVKDANTTDSEKVIASLKKQVFDGPGSIIYIAENNHAYRKTFVGRIRYDNHFDIVWDSKKAIHPEPYPPFKPKKEWNLFLTTLYKSWGNNWANPGK
ncbi:MAG TPA: urea ABC transporter substrate-binding protein [Candidatus Babeliales bacterium]|nr:urea ABC transporter substrate-binding protein [Candidatus Babeliales bacterium]